MPSAIVEATRAIKRGPGAGAGGTGAAHRVVLEVRHDLAHLDRVEGDEIRSRLVRDHVCGRSRGFLVLEQDD